MNTDPGIVALLGLGTVFFGLICIIGLILLMNLIVSAVGKKKAGAPEAAEKGLETAPERDGIPEEKRGELLAAVCAAVAEELGTEVEALRVISFKRI